MPTVSEDSTRTANGDRHVMGCCLLATIGTRRYACLCLIRRKCRYPQEMYTADARFYVVQSRFASCLFSIFTLCVCVV